MDVQVVLHPGAGRPAEVDADVDPLRPEDFPEDPHRAVQKIEQLRSFLPVRSSRFATGGGITSRWPLLYGSGSASQAGRSLPEQEIVLAGFLFAEDAPFCLFSLDVSHSPGGKLNVHQTLSRPLPDFAGPALDYSDTRQKDKDIFLCDTPATVFPNGFSLMIADITFQYRTWISCRFPRKGASTAHTSGCKPAGTVHRKD